MTDATVNEDTNVQDAPPTVDEDTNFGGVEAPAPKADSEAKTLDEVADANPESFWNPGRVTK